MQISAGQKYQYAIKTKDALETQMPDPYKWVEDWVNELGEEGLFVVSISSRVEDSPLRDSNEVLIKKIIYNALTVKVKE